MGDLIEYVVGFVFCRGNVLVIRKCRPEWQRGRYNGIGGKVEDLESPAFAMARECREETAGTLDIPSYEWTHFATLAGDDRVSRFREGAVAKQFRVYFFTTTLPYPPLNNVELATCDSDEPVIWLAAEVATKPPETSRCLPNLQWLIPMAKAAQTLTHDLPYLITERAGA